MKLCWLDVRGLGEIKSAVLEEAVHQRVDAVLSDDQADLAVLPPTLTRVLYLDRAIAHGDLDDTIDVVISGNGDHSELGQLTGKRESLTSGSYVDVHDQASLDKACQAAMSEAWTVVRFADPTKIPLEIVLAAANNASGSTVCVVSSVEEAKIVLGVLERGSEAVMLAPRAVGEVTELKRACGDQDRRLDLVTLTVTAVTHVGLGDRACVDTCSYLKKNEGILVGSHARGLVLGCSETHPLPYMPTRPFRVNAGAIHSYTLATSGRTNYLSELRSGSKIYAVDHTGQARAVVVGRVKIESRPLLSIDAQGPSGEAVNLLVQDDWHVRLLGPDGAVRNVTELGPGDQLLGHLPDKDRHVGYPIDEFCVER
jgi:3-amino-4-hydroxybenzoic acid synthase